MYYTVYQITNTIDGKIYIGKHQTNNLNDDYMGSGKHLKRAIDKYGLENFDKIILFTFDTEEEMNAKEAELVSEEFCKRQDTYNICPGGQGGFGYINKNKLQVCEKQKNGARKFLFQRSFIVKHKISKVGGLAAKEQRRGIFSDEYWNNYTNGFANKTHTNETKQTMRGPRPNFVGENNSQYGTMWITNGQENEKIKRVDSIPEEWYKGRTMK